MALVERYVTSDAAGGGDGSVATPWTLTEAFANAAAGDQVNILSGTYTRSASDTVTNAGTVGSPIVFRGVSSFSPLTLCDNSRANQGLLVGSTYPIINYDGNYNLTVKDETTLFRLKIVTLRAFQYSVILTSKSNIIDCIVKNNAGTGANGITSGNFCVNCDVILYSASAAGIAINTFTFIDSSHVKNTGGNASFIGISTASSVSNCVIYPSSGSGIYCSGSGSATIIGCSIYSQSIAGIITYNGAISTPLRVSNTIFSSCGNAILNPYSATALHPLVSINNLYYNNDNLGFGDWPEIGRINAASDPFVDAANGDLRLAGASEARGAATNGGDIGAIPRVEDYPATSDVKSGVNFDSAYRQGTYDPITDQYTDPGKANVVVSNNYIFAGVSQVAEYPTTATSQAAQLATDQAAVLAKAEYIIEGATILGVDGEYPLDLPDGTPLAVLSHGLLGGSSEVDLDTVIDDAGGNWQTPPNDKVAWGEPNGLSPSVGTMIRPFEANPSAFCSRTDTWRSFLKFCREALPQSATVKIFPGDPSAQTPTEIEQAYFSDGVHRVIALRDEEYSGGRGNHPDTFIIEVFSKTKHDRYQSLLEALRDEIIRLLDGPIPVYDFSDRSAPVLVEGGYIHPVHKGSTRLPVSSEIAGWELTYEVFANRATQRYDT